MDKFNLREYLKNNPLLKEDITWEIDEFNDSADISDAPDGYREEIEMLVKQAEPEISDADLKTSLDTINDYYYREARENAKSNSPEPMSISSKDFANNVIGVYQDDIKLQGQTPSVEPRKIEDWESIVAEPGATFGSNYDTTDLMMWLEKLSEEMQIKLIGFGGAPDFLQWNQFDGDELTGLSKDEDYVFEVGIDDLKMNELAKDMFKRSYDFIKNNDPEWEGYHNQFYTALPNGKIQVRRGRRTDIQNENKMDKFNLKEYLKNNPLLKENIDFPELEDEFEGAMDAMVVEPEIYLQDIIDDPSVVLGDDYFEVYNAVEDGIYSEDEAVELAKKWATDKLSSLAENKTLNEEDESMSMDGLKKLADIKAPKWKKKYKLDQTPDELVDLVMRSVKAELRDSGTSVEDAPEEEVDELRYKWARLKGLLKAKDSFTSWYKPNKKF